MKIAALLVAALSLAACGDDDDGGALDPGATTVEYEYNDSSVPPEYHRSWTLTARQGEARMVVDSYGDVLHDVTEPLDDATWEVVLEEVAALDIAGDEGDGACAGGTSRDLRVTVGDEVVTDVFIDLCGESGSGGADAAEAALAPIIELFDMEALLATGE